MFSQINGKCNHFQILSEIIDKNSDGNASSISYRFIKLINDNDVTKNYTSGWKLQLDWKYGSASWVPLKYLKASNLIEFP